MFALTISVGTNIGVENCCKVCRHPEMESHGPLRLAPSLWQEKSHVEMVNVDLDGLSVTEQGHILKVLNRAIESDEQASQRCW